MLEQATGGAFSYTGNFAQFRGTVANLPPLAVEGHGKTVGFIADQLNQMQYRRVMVECDRFVFLPIDVDDFLALGDRGQRLVDDLQ